MPQRFLPFHAFFDDTPVPREGSRLFFYAETTSTKLDTYPTRADAIAATNANANPIELDEYGEPEVDIWLKDAPYKVVLAGADSTGTDDPPTNVVKTRDNYSHSDFKIFSIRKTGSGNPNGSVAGTAGSSGVLPTEYWDYTNSILYECATTGTASTAVWTAVGPTSSTSAVPVPQGYLTLTSATPSIVSDASAAAAIYYALDNGDLVPIYNGASFVPTTFTQLTLTLHSSHALSTAYDLFVFSNSGVLTLVTGPAWSNSAAGTSARGSGASSTELTRVKGLYVNAVQIAARNGSTTYTVGANLATYLGSVLIDGTAGQATCHRSYGQSRKWALWNAYNRRPIIMKAGDSTSSWTYATNTFRASNNASANSISVFCGLAEDIIDARFEQYVGSSNNDASIAIGWNSATTPSGKRGRAAGAAVAGDLVARYVAVPALGLNTVTALESSRNTNTITFNGTEEHMLLTTQYMG